MRRPLVTVLMPVYNGGHYLRFAIEGILRQRFRDFELLIVNDCSMDDSLSVIRSYRDSRIVVHTNDQNLGQTKSLNIGLKLARGRYVARMDADDLAFSRWLERLVGLFAQYPDHAAIGSAAIVIDSQGNELEVRRPPLTRQEIFFRILIAPPLNHVSVLLNRELILRHGGYDEEFKIVQDYELWSSLVRKGHLLTNSPEILVAYRVHEHSLGSVNRYQRGLQEKADSLFRNTLAMTDLKITREDALLVNRCFYDSGSLSEEEFYRGVTIYESLYRHLKKPFRLSEEFVNAAARQQMVIPYCKFAAEQMRMGDFRIARRVISEYFCRHGFHVIPSIMFGTSLFGRSATDRLPEWLKKYRKIKAQWAQVER